ncbi:MAG: site-specific DNA-methyltransferase [Candidatus Acidiferrales bacterium]
MRWLEYVAGNPQVYRVLLKTPSVSRIIPLMPSVAVRTQKSIQVETTQTLRCADAREMSWLPDASVHLALTSPPYWTLKEYPENKDQLGLVVDYEKFHDELDKVWRHCFRALVPGGRLVCVVGDVCLSRRMHGRHMVMPLHADIVVRCRRIGFDNLSPIFWYKISNAAYEVENGSSFLGKPYEPNAIIKNDMEFILMLRKPGGYRQPTEEQRDASRLTKEEHHDWFKQVWTIPGESTRVHPAPYPEELAYRLVRMFSFVDDTVIDPFMGLGTTLVAAKRCGRNGIGLEIDPSYFAKAKSRIETQPRLLAAVPSAVSARR